MEMHQVRYFIAVCRTLNFTKAAEECNVAQPSLTRAVQKLEEELGGPLFHRERANTHLTELGKLMLPHLEQTYAAAQAAKDLAVSVRKGQVAPLRIGVDSSVSLAPVIEILKRVRKAIEGVELTLGSGTRSEIASRALDGEFDLAVISHSGAPLERIHSWTLYRERGRLVVPSGHAWAGRDNIAFAALDSVALVTGADCSLRPALLQCCELAGATPDLRHTGANERQLQGLVQAGFGLGVLPERAVLAEGLAAVEFEEPSLEREIVLAAVAGRRFSIAADAFVKIARAADWSAAAG